MNTSQMRSALRNWIVAALDDSTWSVVFRNQNAPAPARPYVSLMLMLQQDEGEPYISPPDEYGTAIITKDRSLTASIQTFGDTVAALDMASKVYDSLNKPSMQIFTLRAAGLVFVQHLTAVNDVSALAGPGFEARAQFDAEFRAAVELTDDVGLIERVVGEQKFSGGIQPEIINPFDTGAP